MAIIRPEPEIVNDTLVVKFYCGECGEKLGQARGGTKIEQRLLNNRKHRHGTENIIEPAFCPIPGCEYRTNGRSRYPGAAVIQHMVRMHRDILSLSQSQIRLPIIVPKRVFDRAIKKNPNLLFDLQAQSENWIKDQAGKRNG